MLTRGDIAALKKLQERVQEIERRLTETPSTSKDFTMGRLAEACRAVDDAILQVLIIVKIHGLGEQELRAIGPGDQDLNVLTSQKQAS